MDCKRPIKVMKLTKNVSFEWNKLNYFLVFDRKLKIWKYFAWAKMSDF